MKPDAPTGPVCRGCGQMVTPTRDGGVCGCPRRAPGAVALRAMATVAALVRRGESGIYAMKEVQGG